MTNYREVPTYRGGTEIMVYETIVANDKARFAQELMLRFGMITGIQDGEDAAGRQRTRLLLPAEVVQRACDIAELAYGQFAERNWLLEVPAPKLPNEKAP